MKIKIRAIDFKLKFDICCYCRSVPSSAHPHVLRYYIDLKLILLQLIFMKKNTIRISKRVLENKNKNSGTQSDIDI